MDINKYFKDLYEGVKKEYAVANLARGKGLDPVSKVEIPLAMSLAEKAVGLISTVCPELQGEVGEKITQRILDLEKKYGQLDTTVSFKIAEEIAEQKYCKFDTKLEGIIAGIRVGFAYNTLGVVASPIEGFTDLKLGKTKDGKEYFRAYFSGPIRSAGTTATCVVLMLIDYLREYFGYAKYDPTEEEVKRYVTENHDYHERITNLQYMPTDEELEFLAKNLPIEIAGDPTERLEVSNYKDLERVETNQIRGGMCLTFAEGLAQKAQKGVGRLKSVKDNGLKTTGWDFLTEYLELHKKREKGGGDVVATYIKDLVAGRPVYGHPSKSGGFRFRYGRSRVAGFSATSIHPATMAVSHSFLSTGTQLKIEKPTKGCVVTSCDSIDGPIVKLKNGSVKKLEDFEEAKKLYSDVEEIIYLGDILFPLGDVKDRNYDLLQPGYVEEWWKLQLDKKLEVTGESFDKDFWNLDFDSAIQASEKYSIPLHPKHIFYWTQIKSEDFFWLLDWLQNATWRTSDKDKLVLPYSKSVIEKFKQGKRALELLGVEHEVVLDNVVVEQGNSLLFNLGITREDSIKDKIKELIKNYKDEKDILGILNSVCKYEIKDKAGVFIGSRMGRPEKAKLRKLTGSPNVLFPISEQGGRFRSVNHAVELGYIKSDFPIFQCEKCKKDTIYSLCEDCGEKTKRKFYCVDCKDSKDSKECEKDKEHRVLGYSNRRIDSKYYFDKAVELLGYEKYEVPELIKGVRGTTSEDHDFEHLAKGILRAKYNLCVNKDGTVRYDATELPITHFKPKEVGTSVEKLKELGYDKDVNGNELERDDQVLVLFPHDILLPACPETQAERADEVFMNIANFVDEELERMYGLERFYNIKKREDLVGHLVACMAPHNCAGAIGRIVGFSKAQGLFASPYMHAAMRRDCFDYNTYFPIKSNGVWKIEKIGKIVNKLNPVNVVDGWGTKEKKVSGFETISYKKGLGKCKINNFTKHSKRRMFEIKTALGKVIKVTENHKFLINGKKKRASDLKIGDEVLLPKKIKIPENNRKNINLLDFLKEKELMIRNIKKIINEVDKDVIWKVLNKIKISKKQFQNYFLRDSFPVSFVFSLPKEFQNRIMDIGLIGIKRDNVSVPIKITLDKDLLEVIGLYISEGYSRSIKGRKGLNQVYIANNSKKIRDFVKKTIKKHFNLVPSEKKNDRVTFSSKILYLFFNSILKCGEKSRDKRIPGLFLDLPLDKLAAVLRGYFEGDCSAEIKRKKISCDSVSEGLIYDLEFCLARFGVFAKRYDYEKEPGKPLREFYIKKGGVPKFKITKLIIGADFIKPFSKIGFLSDRKNKIFNNYFNMKNTKMKIKYDLNYVYDPIVEIVDIGERESYCMNVDSESHLVMGNSIISQQCDGDEAAVMMLLDVLLNFSKKFLPSHRGGTQDAPLVLNAHIRPGEVDDQILSFEVCGMYPLELYEKAEKGLHSSEVDIDTVQSRLKKGEDAFLNIGYSHDCSDFNLGVRNSAYKILPTMKDKVSNQMELVSKIRAVDTSDVARLVIERHFIRDIRGNLRKFSHQQFRCVACNEKFRRPPLTGVCTKCGGKIIFTISEGSIKKYLEPALELATNFNIPEYTKQGLDLAKVYIESIFGKELDRQVDLKKWF